MAVSKYAPLGDYLKSIGIAEVRLSFQDIERIIGGKLPEKAQDQRAFWSNNPSNNVMTRVWLDAGFETQRVDMAARRLVFRRSTPLPAKASAPRHATPATTAPALAEAPTTAPEAVAAPPEPDPGPPVGGRHPILGAAKGLLRIGPGVDLTVPADPYWGVA